MTALEKQTNALPQNTALRMQAPKLQKPKTTR